MHEFSLCKSIVDSVCAQMERNGCRTGDLVATHISVGAMRQVVQEQMQCAYAALTKDTAARGSRLQIHICPVKIACNECGWEGEVDSAMVYCPHCHTTDYNLLQGKEMTLEKLEVRKDDEQ